MYTMQECCKLTGLSYDTLKYYCNEGLIPNVKRDKFNNYRIFDDNDINWINSLKCLKKCGFSLKEMRIYLDLCMQGPSTIQQRKQILLRQRSEVEKQITSLNDTLDYIDRKNALYDKFLSGELEYYSYLTKSSNSQ